jgi:hypothetical protein
MVMSTARSYSLLLAITLGAISLSAQCQNSFSPQLWPVEGQSRASTRTPEEVYSIFRIAVDQGKPCQYQLYAFTDPQKRECATLSVSNKGLAILNQQSFCVGLNQISFQSAKDRFGEPRRFGQIAIFDLVGSYWKEPNIFHLEIMFDERNTAEKYRVRGLGISPGDFLNINCEKKRAGRQ